MKIIKQLIAFLAAVSINYSGNLFGQETYYNVEEKLLSVSTFSFLEDTASRLTLPDVIESESFKSVPEKIPNFGLSQSAFWVKFQIKNGTDQQSLHLILEQPNLDFVEIYKINPNGLYEVETKGDFEPFTKRNYNHPNYIFDVNIPKGEQRTFLFKIKSNEPICLPFFVGDKRATIEFMSSRDMFFSFYVGVIFIMLIYNLFIFFTVRDKNYLYYVVYILFILLTQISLKGYHFKYFAPNFPDFSNKLVTILPSMAGITAMEFIKAFLQTKHEQPKLHRGFLLFEISFLISIVLTLFELPTESFQLMQIATMIGSIYALVVGYLAMRRGNNSAKFFLFAWITLLVGAFVFVLKDLGVLPYNDFTNYTLPLGSAIEAVLLSFALANKINTYKKDRLQAIQEKEKVLKEQNVMLEEQVAARTQEVASKNATLTTTIKELKATQNQLVQAEKMASLGQLTAGIAHEINNPMNYVLQSAESIKENFADIRKLISAYENSENLDSTINNKSIEELKDSIELPLIYEEIDDCLMDINEGVSRTIEISEGLRVFSRLDQASFKKVNLIDNLLATLKLMRQEFALKNVTVNQDFDEYLEIDCNSGKLSQVFMNILNNALYAVEKRQDSELKVIAIKAKKVKNEIHINFNDNGIGMSDDTIQRIFDPFFTTKDVGEGTGLGMSISHGIIIEHKGSIEAKSVLGEGTSITIKLPATIKFESDNTEQE